MANPTAKFPTGALTCREPLGKGRRRLVQFSPVIDSNELTVRAGLGWPHDRDLRWTDRDRQQQRDDAARRGMSAERSRQYPVPVLTRLRSSSCRRPFFFSVSQASAMSSASVVTSEWPRVNFTRARMIFT
jgi:hypothetical protein